MFTVTLRFETENQEAVADFMASAMAQAEVNNLPVETATMHKELTLIEKVQTIVAYLEEVREELEQYKVPNSTEKGEEDGENP